MTENTAAYDDVWPDPTERRFGPVLIVRSNAGYGWSIFLGKRLRWSSRKATTPGWPRISRGGDENCNRAVTLVLWPLGHLDVWWEPRWRTDADGPCEECRAMCRAEGCCEWCGSRPCCCDERRAASVSPSRKGKRPNR